MISEAPKYCLTSCGELTN